MADSPISLDDLDHEILKLLSEDARRSPAAIAEHMDLSPTAIRRRIGRLEELEVIVTYTTVIDHKKVDNSLEAYVELDFTVQTDVQKFLAKIVEKPEVREASVLAGHPDAIVRLRIDNVDQLRNVVLKLREEREHGEIIGSNTLVALGRMRHVSKRRDTRSAL